MEIRSTSANKFPMPQSRRAAEIVSRTARADAPELGAIRFLTPQPPARCPRTRKLSERDPNEHWPGVTVEHLPMAFDRRPYTTHARCAPGRTSRTAPDLRSTVREGGLHVTVPSPFLSESGIGQRRPAVHVVHHRPRSRGYGFRSGCHAASR